MVICGLKLTHDSSVTIIEDNKVVLCLEWEKLNNNNRFKLIDCLEDIDKEIIPYGYNLANVDRISIDGWVGEEHSTIKTRYLGIESEILAAPYHEPKGSSVLRKYGFDKLAHSDLALPYESFTHAAGHVLSSYCTSPFASRMESSYILVWDGGMYPRLYFFDSVRRSVVFICDLFYMAVNVYSIFCQHYGPFKINENVIKDELSVAGKVMAYVGYGRIDNEIIEDLKRCYSKTLSFATNPKLIPQYPYIFSKEFQICSRDKKYTDEDVICSLHYFLEGLIISSIKKAVAPRAGRMNLCLAGGAALNIKWNTALRNSGIFDEVWVPPFPNDAGSSLGAALASWAGNADCLAIAWNVYSGPTLTRDFVPDGWTTEECSPVELARILYQTRLPVTVLNGRAEIGPRALGNRSIVAAPFDPKMKDQLNYLKIREYYRPIAPMCSEERAVEFFNPGCPDPYMLFEHTIRDEWVDLLGAVSHIDNSARLQTVNSLSHPFLHELLMEFEKLSGIPILCNTSANFKGRGFFPDIESAIRWGLTPMIYSDGRLYTKESVLSMASI
ncbi:carbamoyltransferase N-terminal domain-containing protein [Chryseolinea lacunae]|uniref:Nodulation protein NodU n=1 Tax=Chryseolinea lacunae TaxID=2801331 RepID=A0ABS1KNM8_9BACT|nr:carbamoyltransferase N-terminal domain-containing protein [Chryseolinea lacunae]MBL0741060.1 nodulation protein NodU [Chryseolinea lacunae]